MLGVRPVAAPGEELDVALPVHHLHLIAPPAVNKRLLTASLGTAHERASFSTLRRAKASLS